MILSAERLRRLFGLFVCLTVSFALAAGAEHSAVDPRISADNPQLQFTGRIDFSNVKAPVLSWPGSAVSLQFTGTSISVVLDDQYGKNYFSAFIDENWNEPVILALKPGEQTYVIARDLPEGTHKLTLYKRTEGEEGATAVKGFILNPGGELQAPPPRPQRRIEFFGDSITSGMGNEAPEAGEDDKLSEKNHFLSYAAITARALAAEHHSISQSGIGVMVSWFDFIMPQFYDQLSAVGNNDSRWNFSRWTPDVVVINLLQNDSWLVEKRLNPVPTEAQRIQAYYDFVNQIRQHYPNTFIICALGSMDATKQGSPWPGYIHAAVERRKREHQDQRIATLFFPFTDFYKHPRVRHHRANAELLTEFIRQQMQW